MYVHGLARVVNIRQRIVLDFLHTCNGYDLVVVGSGYLEVQVRVAAQILLIHRWK